jgi:hypothetical protein
MFDEHLDGQNPALQSSRTLTNGCPFGFTPGPCNEWHGIISTSVGKCFSNAAISGALHEVCPPTMAPSFVAELVSEASTQSIMRQTRPIFSHYTINILRLNAVDDVVATSRNKVAIRINCYILLMDA